MASKKSVNFFQIFCSKIFFLNFFSHFSHFFTFFLTFFDIFLTFFFIYLKQNCEKKKKIVKKNFTKQFQNKIFCPFLGEIVFNFLFQMFFPIVLFFSNFFIFFSFFFSNFFQFLWTFVEICFQILSKFFFKCFQIVFFTFCTFL